jgi:hypothetical protein
MEDNIDPLGNLPDNMKPAALQPKPQPIKILDTRGQKPQPRKKRSAGKIIAWVIVIIIVIIALVQFLNAAKYQALVQVIKEDRIGVNPTGKALDFGDLPRDKSAIRTVNLVSNGNTASYIMVWKFGGISDLITVDRNYFTLQAHTTEKLQFTAYIPNSANYQYYKGEVIIFQIPKVW